MPDTFTANLTLTQPQVGSSTDTWGTKLNANLAVIDALFAPSGAGTVVTKNSANEAAAAGAAFSQAAGNSRWVRWLSGASERWVAGADSTAESGGNAGSDFNILRIADDGATVLGTSFQIERETGQATFETTPQVGTSALITQAVLDAFIPLGTMYPWTGGGYADPPGGHFILAEGRAISRTTYAAYFALVGTTYGAGDGVTTFNIPDMRERIVVGITNSQSRITQYNATVLGATFGESLHQLSLAEAPRGLHALNDPEHSHLFGHDSSAGLFEVQNGGTQIIPYNIDPHGFYSGPTTSSATGITLTDNAGGGSHNNIQPSFVCPWLIRIL